MPYRKPRKKSRYKIILFLLLLGCIGYVWFAEAPNDKHVSFSFEGKEKPLFFRGELYKETALGQGNTLRFPLSFIQEYIDSGAYYEAESKSVILTTSNRVIRAIADNKTAEDTGKTISLEQAVTVQDGEAYVPASLLKSIYGTEVREEEQNGIVLVWNAGEEYQTARINGAKDETRPLRSGPSSRSPIYSDVSSEETMYIWGEAKPGWVKVQLQNGVSGYMKEGHLGETEAQSIPAKEEPSFQAWKPEKGKINVTWGQIVTKHPKTENIPDMPGLNVISPTWFRLSDGQGNIVSLASSDYAAWARQRGYQIWALFSNSFEPGLTTEALSSFDRRKNAITQVIESARQLGIQGINVDFENVKTTDKDNFTQFVRELTAYSHSNELTISVDVTPKSNTENWSLFLDRKALGKITDYMIVMAYDEHWASSPKAGSVASLPWVEQVLTKILKEDEVPPSKMILGIPFFTRLWTEEEKDEKTEVSSKAMAMSAVETLVQEKNLTPIYDEKTKQNYVEYQEDGKTYKIWMEDETSMKARMEVMNRYNLAGLASWRRGFEKPDVWPAISSFVNP